MRTKTLLISLLLFVLSVVLTPKTTKACTCSSQLLNDREDVARQFAGAAVVFEGEVISGGSEIVAASRDKMGLSVTVFRVIRFYKGERAESSQIFDAMAGTSCALGQPAPGEKYFVYGFQGKDGKIYYQACSRTGPLESAGPDLRYARGEPATKEDLSPPGQKWRLRGDFATRGATLRGNVHRLDGGEVSDVFLTVWDVDEKGRRENRMSATQKVNADSSYEVRFLAPGQYRVTAEDSRMTPTTRFVGEYGNISLAEGQTLVAVDVMLRPEPLGKVTIQVNAPTELHDRIFVWLRDAETDTVGSAPYHYAQTAHLDEKNVASFEFVPYGRYDVYVMLTGEDLTKPSWTHDDVQVQLNGNQAETTVALRKNH
jgi:hypothetical protein